MYTFRCEKCNKQEEINIPMSEYDEEKDKQVCVHCGGKTQKGIGIQWNCESLSWLLWCESIKVKLD